MEKQTKRKLTIAAVGVLLVLVAAAVVGPYVLGAILAGLAGGWFLREKGLGRTIFRRVKDVWSGDDVEDADFDVVD